MEKQNPAFHPKKHRPVETGDASRVPHPRSVGESPPKKEEERRGHFAEQAQRWEVQWHGFLERVRSQEVLEEAALWQEAKALLASFEQKAETPRSPQEEGAKKPTPEQTLAILPLELQRWLGECGPQTCSEAVALAKAFSWRQQESCRRGKQVVAGSSSSAVLKNPSDFRQEKDEELSILGHVPVSENEGDPHWMLLERDEGKTPCGWQRRRGQERKGGHQRKVVTTEERMDKSVPSLRGALQEQEKPTEEREKSPGTPRSINTEGGKNKASSLAESSPQLRMSESGTVGTEDEPRTSSECVKSFAQRDQLGLNQRTHTGEKPHKCPHCSRSFAQKSDLMRHLRIHSGEKPYQCSECGKSFNQIGTLFLHKRTHTGEKPHKCSRCSKSFATRSNLMNHIRTHSREKPYQCFECGKSFKQAAALFLHKKTHTGEKPHKCPHCSRNFGQKSNLMRHLRIYIGEKTYQCSECGKNFRQGKTLHTSERPYICSKCERTFSLHQRRLIEQGESVPHHRHSVVYWRPWPNQLECVPSAASQASAPLGTERVPAPQLCSQVVTEHEPAQQLRIPMCRNHGEDEEGCPQGSEGEGLGGEGTLLSQLLHTHTACASAVTTVSQQPPVLSPCQRHTDTEETHRHTFRFSFSPTRTPEAHAHGQSCLLSLSGHQNTDTPCTARSLSLLPLSSSSSSSPQLLPSLSPLIPTPHPSPAIWRPFQETQLVVPPRASFTVPCSSSSLSLSRGADKTVVEREEKKKTGRDAG